MVAASPVGRARSKLHFRRAQRICISASHASAHRRSAPGRNVSSVQGPEASRNDAHFVRITREPRILTMGTRRPRLVCDGRARYVKGATLRVCARGAQRGGRSLRDRARSAATQLCNAPPPSLLGGKSKARGADSARAPASICRAALPPGGRPYAVRGPQRRNSH